MRALIIITAAALLGGCYTAPGQYYGYQPNWGMVYQGAQMLNGNWGNYDPYSGFPTQTSCSTFMNTLSCTTY